MLFAGGHGGLRIAPNGSMLWGERDFLVRSRWLFAERGIAVALLDAPSDCQSRPFLSGHRQRPEQVADVRAVAAWLRKQSRTPLWLVGTGQGTQSAAFAATELADTPESPDGLVLTATVLDDPRSRPVPAMPLERLRIPVLVVHHERDCCEACPQAMLPALLDALDGVPRKALLRVDGGRSAGDPCGAAAHHGFNGAEVQVVGAIADWVAPGAAFAAG